MFGGFCRWGFLWVFCVWGAVRHKKENDVGIVEVVKA